MDSVPQLSRAKSATEHYALDQGHEFRKTPRRFSGDHVFNEDRKIEITRLYSMGAFGGLLAKGRTKGKAGKRFVSRPYRCTTE